MKRKQERENETLEDFFSRTVFVQEMETFYRSHISPPLMPLFIHINGGALMEDSLCCLIRGF